MNKFGRKRLFEIIEVGAPADRVSQAYDYLMMVAIFVSIFPLMFMEDHPAFHFMEHVTVVLFILDYLFRWMTADLRLGKGNLSFLLYPIIIRRPADLLPDLLDELRRRNHPHHGRKL